MGKGLDKTCHSFLLTTGICTPLLQSELLAESQIHKCFLLLVLFSGMLLAPPTQLKDHLHRCLLSTAICQIIREACPLGIWPGSPWASTVLDTCSVLVTLLQLPAYVFVLEGKDHIFIFTPSPWHIGRCLICLEK